MLLEKITEAEMGAITWYREAYATHQYGNRIGAFVDSKTILKEWEEAKSQYLFKMFGEELVLKKHFDYEKSKEELERELNDILYPSWEKRQTMKHNGFIFRNNFIEFLQNSSALRSYNKREVISYLYELINSDTLLNNKYMGATFDLYFDEKKKYRVSTGCKASKALGKIADGFGIEGFEDFRICLSQVLNQKSLGGNLVLSIHPIDYMTMSDNECGWDSCMSWRNYGEYCRGTVEMMNSNCVVVAYLESEAPMNFGGISWAGNKKWRELIIVDENVISNVKQYPYSNNNLSQLAVSWIKELAESNLGWKFNEVKELNDLNECFSILDKEDKEVNVSINFYTGVMYNDFDHCASNTVAIGKDITLEDLQYNSWNGYQLSIGYSGAEQCMVCGEITDAFEHEGVLSCSSCISMQRCEWCDEYSDDLIELESGEMVCSYCYNEHYTHCEECEELIVKDDAYNIYVIPRLSKEEQKETFNKELEKYPWRWNVFNEEDEFSFFNNIDFRLCEKCFNDFRMDALVEEACIYESSEWSWGTTYFVYFDDLKREYIVNSGLGMYSTNTGYKLYLQNTGKTLHNLGIMTPLK